MTDQLPCPSCGAPVYVTDAQCLSCGLQLDEGHAAELAAPAATTAGAPAQPGPEETFVAPRVGPPATIITVAVLNIIGAAATLALGGLVLLVMAFHPDYGVGTSGALWDVAGCLLALTALCVGTIVISVYLWRGASWARRALIVLLSVQAGGALIVTVMRAHLASGSLVSLTVPAVLLATLCSRSAREYCS